MRVHRGDACVGQNQMVFSGTANTVQLVRYPKRALLPILKLQFEHVAVHRPLRPLSVKTIVRRGTSASIGRCHPRCIGRAAPRPCTGGGRVKQAWNVCIDIDQASAIVIAAGDVAKIWYTTRLASCRIVKAYLCLQLCPESTAQRFSSIRHWYYRS